MYYLTGGQAGSGPVSNDVDHKSDHCLSVSASIGAFWILPITNAPVFDDVVTTRLQVLVEFLITSLRLRIPVTTVVDNYVERTKLCRDLVEPLPVVRSVPL